MQNQQLEKSSMLQAPPAYAPVQDQQHACPPHDFRKTGNWDMVDMLTCLCFFPFNFCFCAPGEREEKCSKCGLKQ